MMAILYLALTIAVYIISKKIYQRWSYPFFSPVILSMIGIIAILKLTHLDYTEWMTGNIWLSKMLGPATVAFVVPLYKFAPLIKKHFIEIISSLVIGSFAAIVSTVMLGKLMHLDPSILKSMAPRSVTTPIAMDISQTIGGIPSMTAIFVVITGLTSVIGPFLIRHMKIKSQLAKGTLLGMGAHGMGAAQAYAIGSVEGSVSSLSIIIAGGSTLALAPLVTAWL
ncbi:LrgB family protein [Paenibacillus sp. N1-5-1-14]|uniref:LrgB family protein n=1 Tax=Paenibacillus radicibacter TaxID=2972488 RepID=UPI002158CFF0|nr:LrgB family protein [Paenibacillus radicibacter]MCR8641336.1 LrgB family protein [Paenibacillus radicibacter]